MSLRQKIETAIRDYLAANISGLNLYRSQENQTTTRETPAVVIEAAEAAETIPGALSFRVRVHVSLFTSADKDASATVNPEDTHAAFASAVADALYQPALAASLSALATGFHVLKAYNIGPLRANPEDRHLMDAWALDLIALEADCD